MKCRRELYDVPEKAKQYFAEIVLHGDVGCLAEHRIGLERWVVLSSVDVELAEDGVVFGDVYLRRRGDGWEAYRLPYGRRLTAVRLADGQHLLRLAWWGDLRWLGDVVTLKSGGRLRMALVRV